MTKNLCTGHSSQENKTNSKIFRIFDKQNNEKSKEKYEIHQFDFLRFVPRATFY